MPLDKQGLSATDVASLGHIQSDCPQPPERQHAAAACVEGEDKEKAATHAAVDAEPQEEEVPPADAE